MDIYCSFGFYLPFKIKNFCSGRVKFLIDNTWILSRSSLMADLFHFVFCFIHDDHLCGITFLGVSAKCPSCFPGY